MKYIIFSNNEGYERPIIFPEVINHDAMAESMAHLYLMETGQLWTPISAGFCSSKKVVCSGDSKTLNLKNRPYDSLLLTYYDSLSGVKVEDLPPMVLSELNGRFEETQ